ncbi:MAG TPA: TlpA disulfide reductase family protein [Nitriliruptorales bacterium]|nr:TlpA disulfide reductase family protein [Nitriliruptorales bacterium]
MQGTRRATSPARLLAALVPLVAVGVVVLVATGGAPSAEDASVTGLRLTPPAERVTAPSDRAPLLVADGAAGLGDFRGDVVVLNFWASWCGPCRAEQPELNAAYRQLAGLDVTFLGVDLQDTEANAAAHWREFDVPYDSLLDPANVYASKFRGVGPSAIPTTIFIDRQGRVAGRHFGKTTTPDVVAVVRDLLREEPS